MEKWNSEHHAFNIIELFLPSERITRIIGFLKKEAYRKIRHVMNLKDIIWDAAEEESRF